ncbi:sterol O-acyltransferase 2 [Pholidichthys leucotaenia]
MATAESPKGVHHRNIKSQQSENFSPGADRDNMQEGDWMQWQKQTEKIKTKVMEQVQDQLSEILDRVLSESVQSLTHSQLTINGKTTSKHSSGAQRMDKVFMPRASLLDELFEISHIRTIYHMFIAVLLIFCLSSLAVDYIDQSRLVLEFDLLFFAFGKLGVVIMAWVPMFLYTLLVPYYTLVFWGSLYHTFPSKLLLSLGVGLILSAIQMCVLGVFPVYMVVQNQLPPASRLIVILEQIRFLMKTYSFIREMAPVKMKNAPKKGESPRLPTFSSYLYFLFAPTLIYRESYPRNSHIRWKYVCSTAGMILGCLFYGYFIIVRLCMPVFRPENNNQPFSKRTIILNVFHSILPGIMLLLICFFAFLHCWLNLFAELLRFADRMFYKDWWNSTSFANYYRTWNVVVHDWLYYYGYRDFLWLSGKRFRAAAMLSVFIVSAVVHEYALAMGFGFFYPVMFFLFGVIGVAFNFTMNDKRQSPVFNVIMWVCLFLGQGVQVCLYCQEWYAQIHCPPTGTSFWELVIPRSWSCNYQR